VRWFCASASARDSHRQVLELEAAQIEIGKARAFHTVRVVRQASPAPLLDQPTLLLGGRDRPSRPNADPHPPIASHGRVVRRLDLDHGDCAAVQDNATNRPW